MPNRVSTSHFGHVTLGPDASPRKPPNPRTGYALILILFLIIILHREE
jgi:hypothetical protein